MNRRARIPAMANAHSHAFQLDLRGIGERVGRPGDDFWSWRTEMYRLAGSPRPRIDAGGRRSRLRTDGRRRLRRRRRVPLRPPPARRHALRRAQRDGDRPRRGGGRRRAGDHPAAGRLPPAGGPGDWSRRPASAGSATRRSRRSWSASTACASGPPTAPGVSVGVAAHSMRAVPAAWLTAIAEYAERHGLVRHVHASEQRRELAEIAAEHGCSPIELLDADRVPGTPHERDPRDPRRRARTSTLLARSDSIVVTCPTTEGNLGDGVLPALRYRDAGVRLAIGTDEQTRIDPFEELREMETLARREGQTRDALLAAADGDLWGRTLTNGRASLGPAGLRAGHDRARSRPPRSRRPSPSRDLGLALATCASAAVVLAGVGDPRP